MRVLSFFRPVPNISASVSETRTTGTHWLRSQLGEGVLNVQIGVCVLGLYLCVWDVVVFWCGLELGQSIARHRHTCICHPAACMLEAQQTCVLVGLHKLFVYIVILSPTRCLK